METITSVTTNKWGKAAGKGPLGLDWSGCYPATVIPFTDRTCREIDEDAFRILVRDLLESDIAGIDPNEVEGLSRQETIRLMQIAKEEVRGRVPVTGKVEARNGQWTWDLIQEAEKVIEAGADVLYLHPWPEGDNMEDFVNLYRTFDKAFDVPIIALMVGVPVPVIKEISLACKNIAAWKFYAGEDLRLMKQLVWSLQEAEAVTGRHISPLRGGDESLVECLMNGAEGNFNGAASWRGREDVAIYQAVNRGDLNEAFAIQKKIEAATEAVRGRHGSKTLPFWRFPHRYKLAAWLLGKVPNPYARLPRIAFSDEEVLLVRDALIRSGFEVVREPGECRNLGSSSY
ncbi:dihydrodipicolinate synthase family protein [Cupriavidus sp. WKF15]|uniref:dihydrodipicolinate synthase family protein n=1 Tax=Cupriavidus sp. WKF15 TaxID=3032282 RepID=UPI0023E2B1E8|nr:dihydrodipicolinate synthase family protein [Cupriavidus sp. WKF15]WER50766.1 dihydrodipicolinate synthase family protein [Cupriavidus sp. WKF15]